MDAGTRPPYRGALPTPTSTALNELATRVTRIAAMKGTDGGWCDLGIPGLGAMVSERTTPLTPTMYHPVVCLILQGSKELELGDGRLRCGTGQSVIVSHTVPLRSEITKASTAEPYVALIQQLDADTLVSLDDDSDEAYVTPVDSLALAVDAADAPTLDAFRRLVDLTEQPRDVEVLAPLVLREIHYRLLGASHAPMLRQLRRRGSNARRISKVINHIRDDLARPVAVPDLARIAGMSQSSFHEHFKTVTATTPLQFQKDLRLLEARRLLADDGHTVTEAALAVGYSSPTQFSREYSRKFGIAPRHERGRTPVAV